MPLQTLACLAERADCIILLFDANKLDISDEFSDALSSIKMFDSKIRVVLNKADQISSQQLLRVYGALMWSLGKVHSKQNKHALILLYLWLECVLFEFFINLHMEVKTKLYLRFTRCL